MTEPNGFRYSYKKDVPVSHQAIRIYDLMERAIFNGHTSLAEKLYDDLCIDITELTGLHRPLAIANPKPNQLVAYQINTQYASKDERLTFIWDDNDGQHIEAAFIDEWINDTKELEKIGEM